MTHLGRGLLLTTVCTFLRAVGTSPGLTNTIPSSLSSLTPRFTLKQRRVTTNRKVLWALGLAATAPVTTRTVLVAVRVRKIPL